MQAHNKQREREKERERDSIKQKDNVASYMMIVMPIERLKFVRVCVSVITFITYLFTFVKASARARLTHNHTTS